MIYKILTYIHNKQWFERKNINFSHSRSFDDCSCHYADHEIFVIRCKYCLYNVAGFARNYLASVQCSCVEAAKGEVCQHCKQLAHSINFSVMKFCINSQVVKKEFMEEMNFMKINHYLEKVLKGCPIFYFSKEKNRVLISIDLLDWGNSFINKETM